MGRVQTAHPAAIRGAGKSERSRRLRELFERIARRRPDPRYAGKSDEEVVAMIKRTRDAMWKARLADRR